MGSLMSTEEGEEEEEPEDEEEARMNKTGKNVDEKVRFEDGVEEEHADIGQNEANESLDGNGQGVDKYG